MSQHRAPPELRSLSARPGGFPMARLRRRRPAAALLATTLATAGAQEVFVSSLERNASVAAPSSVLPPKAGKLRGSSPSRKLTEEPTEEGCFVWTPSGCPSQSFCCEANEWMPLGIDFSPEECLQNKGTYDVWCGATDTIALFVEPPDPTDPGCFLRSPANCPGRPGELTKDWAKEISDTKNECDQRGISYKTWCSSLDVQTIFVEPCDAVEDCSGHGTTTDTKDDRNDPTCDCDCDLWWTGAECQWHPPSCADNNPREDGNQAYDCRTEGLAVLKPRPTEYCDGGECSAAMCCEPTCADTETGTPGQQPFVCRSPVADKDPISVTKCPGGVCDQAFCCRGTCTDTDPTVDGEQPYVCSTGAVQTLPLPLVGCEGDACNDAHCCEPSCVDYDMDNEGAQVYECSDHQFASDPVPTVACAGGACGDQHCCRATCSDADLVTPGSQPYDGCMGGLALRPVFPLKECIDGNCDVSTCCLGTCLDTNPHVLGSQAFVCTRFPYINPTPTEACASERDGPETCRSSDCCAPICGDYPHICGAGTEVIGPDTDKRCSWSDGCSADVCCTVTCRTFSCPSHETIIFKQKVCGPGGCTRQHCCVSEEDVLVVPTASNFGCWTQMPSECPSQRQCCASIWKFDDRQGAYDTSEACDERKHKLDEWCSSTDTVVSYQLPPPEMIGCWFRLPSGCPGDSSLDTTSWHRHFLPEDAGKEDCDEVIEYYNGRCSTSSGRRLISISDTVVHFVAPPPASNGGCWLRVPRGCPARPGGFTSDWFRDTFHKGYINEDTCKERLQHWKSRCGLDIVQMHFVEPEGIRYFRFRPTRVRLGHDFQISELYFRYGMEAVSLVGATASGDFDKKHPAQNAIDGSLDTKICCNFGAVTIRFPQPTLLDDFSFATGDDKYQRDPMRWIMEGSLDGNRWLMLNEQKEDYIPPSKRRAKSDWFVLGQRSANVSLQPVPELPGCWVRTPTGCPRQATCCGTDWRSEPKKGSADSSVACEQRKEDYNKFCGIQDTRVVYNEAQGEKMRFFKFTPTKVRSGLEFQLAELGFRYNGESLVMAHVVASGDFEVTEPAGYTLDGILSTKVCCSMNPIFVTFQDAVVFNEFAITTANDKKHRDPVRWTLEGSTDENNWVTLHHQDSDYETPQERYAQSEWFKLGIDVWEAVVQPPAMPGCWVRTPSGCPAHARSSLWRKDASTDRKSCMARKHALNSWCDVTDAEVHFVQPEGLPFKHFLFTPTRVRSGAEFALAEMVFAYDGHEADMSQAEVSGDFEYNRPGRYAVDGIASTKICCGASPVKLTFPEPLYINEFRFTTANDKPSRDPVRWRLEGSADAVSWGTLHEQLADYAVPTQRFENTEWLATEVVTKVSPRLPTRAGCWIRTPTRCPAQSTWAQTTWKRDTARGAQDSPAKCEERKKDHDRWCKVSDTEWYYVKALVSYKWFRFVPQQVRERSPFDTDEFAISEIAFAYNGNKLDMRKAKAFGSVNLRNGEHARSAIDGNLNTKACCYKKPITVKFPAAVVADSFSFTTAGDAVWRDPVRWVLRGSKDGKSWTVLHTMQQNYDSPTDRFTQSTWFSFTGG